MAGRDARHPPFIVQRARDASDLGFFRKHEVQAAENALHPILDRARSREDLLYARMGTARNDYQPGGCPQREN